MNNLRSLTGIILLLLAIGCKKKEDSLNFQVETYGVYDVTESEAFFTGGVTRYGDAGTNDIVFGFCWNTQENPTLNNNLVISKSGGVGNLSGVASDLIPNTTYYFRAFVTDGSITSYGKQMSFKTIALPVLKSDDAFNITDSSATVTGRILNNGGTEIISAGICWALDTLYGYYPTGPKLDLNNSFWEASKGSIGFSFNINGLHAWTRYAYCTYAVTDKGIAFGSNNYFRTVGDGGDIGSVKDTDGNVYKTVTIKHKEWMVDKLETKRYANNDSIPFESNILVWPDLKKGAYQYLITGIDGENNPSKIYNFYAIVDTRNVCPVGWHVSTDKEWEGLIDYLGGYKHSAWALLNVLQLPTDLTCWAVSEDKTSGGIFTHTNDFYKSKISLEKNTKYSGLSVICVKD